MSCTTQNISNSWYHKQIIEFIFLIKRFFASLILIAASFFIFTCTTTYTSHFFFKLDYNWGNFCEDVDESIVAIDLLLRINLRAIHLNKSFIAKSIEFIESCSVELSLHICGVVVFHFDSIRKNIYYFLFMNKLDLFCFPFLFFPINLKKEKIIYSHMIFLILFASIFLLSLLNWRTDLLA